MVILAHAPTSALIGGTAGWRQPPDNARKRVVGDWLGAAVRRQCGRAAWKKGVAAVGWSVLAKMAITLDTPVAPPRPGHRQRFVRARVRRLGLPFRGHASGPPNWARRSRSSTGSCASRPRRSTALLLSRRSAQSAAPRCSSRTAHSRRRRWEYRRAHGDTSGPALLCAGASIAISSHGANLALAEVGQHIGVAPSGSASLRPESKSPGWPRTYAM
jgi:hypothetical protein